MQSYNKSLLCWIHTITSLIYFILIASCAQHFLLPDERLVVVKYLIFISISYPDSPPEVYVSANDLTRSAQDLLNSTLQDYMASVLVPGECCLFLVVVWVREHAQGKVKDEGKVWFTQLWDSVRYFGCFVLFLPYFLD